MHLMQFRAESEHVLDWFPITMRITVMTQLAKGLRTPPELSVNVVEQLQRLTWFLWHGNVFRALQTVQDLEIDLDADEPSVSQAKLAKAVREFGGYLTANASCIPHYGERRRAGETLSTSTPSPTTTGAGTPTSPTPRSTGTDVHPEPQILYYALEAAGVVAAALLLTHQARLGWFLTLGVAAGPILGYVLSRGPGLPDYTDDIGNWNEPLGVIGLIVEGVLLILAATALLTSRSRAG